MTTRPGPKRTALAALTGVALLAIAACDSSGDGDSDAGSHAAGSPATETSASEASAYPATINTAFGPVTIDEEPQRVVALGWGDAEVALSLGVQPVGASDWMGFGGAGVGPWLADAYDTPPMLIETLEPSSEAIAALEPDLILDVRSSGDADRYARLSSIASTLGVPAGGEGYLTSSAQQLDMIAQALGKSAEAVDLQGEMDAAFATVRDAHPDWSGMEATVATRTSEGWGAYVEGDARVEFMSALGFAQSATVAALPVSSNGFSVRISNEQLDLLDADVVIAFPIFIATTEITDDPQFLAVPAVANGRFAVVDGDLSAAFSLGTAIATQYAIEKITPMLDEALA